MKNTELRIGNLVEWNGEIGVISQLFEMEVVFKCGESDLYTALKPIPLTEEWLLKLGFKYDEFFVLKFENDSFDKFNIVGVGKHKVTETHKKYLSEKAKERNSGFSKEHYQKARASVKNPKGGERKRVIKIDTNELFDSIIDNSLKY